MLKNIISNLSSRSNFKHNLRCDSAYENFKRSNLTDERILEAHLKKMKKDDHEKFEIDPAIFRVKEEQIVENDDEEMMDTEAQNEKAQLDELSSYLKNPAIVPQQKLPTTLYDLKNLLQVIFFFFLCLNDASL